MTTENSTHTLLHDATVEVVNRAQELLELTHVATNDDGTCSDSTCPCQEFARKEVEQPQLWADAATVRAAVLDVIDGGCDCGIQAGETGRHAPWVLDDEDEDFANQQRTSFADAVLRRVAQLQQLHDYPQMQKFCDYHKRRRLPSFDGECVDCARQRGSR